jgi:hypothetical protein
MCMSGSPTTDALRMNVILTGEDQTIFGQFIGG